MNTNIATTKLNELFKRWQEKHPEYKGKFTKDGINDESIYNEQKPKLLFIEKEKNDPEQSPGDFRESWVDPDENKYLLGNRICEWSYGIFNGFPGMEEIPQANPEQAEIMKRIAFMNLKKSGGGGTTNYPEFLSVVENEKDFISEEIEIINPDVIIGGIVSDHVIWNHIFPGIEFKDCGCDILVAKYKSYKVIDFYHPSSRAPAPMSYRLMQCVFRSKVFNNL
ncbi:MAG: hypothetical protein OD918_09135 [Gammaproteobacteria bacterium]